MKNDCLNKARFAMESLVMFRQLHQSRIFTELHSLLLELSLEKPDPFRSVSLYSSLCQQLFNAGTSLEEYIIDSILHTETPFSRAAEICGAESLGGSAGTGLKHDLCRLQLIAGLKPEDLKNLLAQAFAAGGYQDAERPEHAGKYQDAERPEFAAWLLKHEINGLPAWTEGYAEVGNEHCSEYGAVKKLFRSGAAWSDLAGELAGYHHRHGSGIFSRYRAFVWRKDGQRGYLDGVVSPDPIRFSDMVSYEPEREGVIENTLRFLEGRPANNILLYGDRGTGKSSTVKALVNEYHTRGLRMIEVPKKHLADFPVIIRQLAGRSLRFILFVDDLAFEDNEENYTALKAALEGGLESKPDNVLIYATSNRKHLIKERFSDRAGLSSGNDADEVRAADTMQEKLSLSDRFGMTAVFSSPDKKRYLEIVDGIIKSRGLHADTEFLHREALRWELRYNGRSPRTAKQFVDWLEGQISK